MSPVATPTSMTISSDADSSDADSSDKASMVAGSTSYKESYALTDSSMESSTSSVDADLMASLFPSSSSLYTEVPTLGVSALSDIPHTGRRSTLETSTSSYSDFATYAPNVSQYEDSGTPVTLWKLPMVVALLLATLF